MSSVRLIFQQNSFDSLRYDSFVTLGLPLSEPAIKNQAELILKRTLVTTVLVSAAKDVLSAS
jgi:hypothetical protein